MSNELSTYNTSIRQRIEQIVAALDGLSPAQLNWRPYDGGNSVFTLATHTLGNARAFVLGIAAGRDVTRDRPAEFASSGDDAAALRNAAAALIAEIEATLAALDPASLDEMVLPPRMLFGDREPFEISRRWALVQVVEHASLHLGHLEVTKELMLANG